jgi:hypothetical protein
MPGIKDKVRRLVPFLFGSAAQRGIEDELLFHIEMRTQDNIASGMAHHEAREDAEERFGNLENIKTDCLKIHRHNHVAMKTLNCLLWLLIAFGLALRLTGSTRGIRPTGDLIVLSAILLRLLIHLRLKPITPGN